VTNRSSFLAGALALSLAAGVPACGPPPLSLPAPPQDLTALQQAYASPTGTIDTARLQQTVSDAKAQFAAQHLDALPAVVAAALVRVRQKFFDTDFPTDPLVARKKNRPSLQAVVDAQHTCQGWTTPVGAPDPAANGSLDLTAVIDDTQLQRNIWGNASSCQERVPASGPLAVSVFLSGMVGILLQGPLPADDQQAEALVLLTGQFGTESDVGSGSIDFQIVGPEVQFRHTVSDGYVIVGVGTQAISVRGSNGTFTCDLSGLACMAVP